MAAITYANPAQIPAPVGQYTNVAIVDHQSSVAYVAGQLPLDENGKLVGEGDFAIQAQVAFDNLANALGAAGSSLAEAAYVRAFLVNEHDLPQFRAVRAEAYLQHGVTDPPPATTVLVKGLIEGSLIELDAVAVVSPKGEESTGTSPDRSVDA